MKRAKRSLLCAAAFFAVVTGVLSMPVISYAKKKELPPPVHASNLEDGTYQVEMTSNASMFRIVHAELEIADGHMEVTMTMSGKGYGKLYPGTGEEALKAPEEEFIPCVEDVDGAYTFTVPVEALNQEFDCAAFSKKRERWYDRKLAVLSDSLPEEAWQAPARIEAKDGNYTMEVSLSGGSGRAALVSPTLVQVSDKTAVVSLEWDSSNYDYMIVGGRKYLPVNTEGNSLFEFPVMAFDEEVRVIADTVAMSRAHEIEYTLVFHSDTLMKVKAAVPSGVIAVAVMVLAAAGGVLFAGTRAKEKKKTDEN